MFSCVYILQVVLSFVSSGLKLISDADMPDLITRIHHFKVLGLLNSVPKG